MILLVNQHTVPVFTDVANAFAHGGQRITLFTGHVEAGRVPLDPSIRKIISVRYNRRHTLTRLTSWTLFSIHYFFYLLFCKKPTQLLVVTNPPIAPFITALVSGFRRIPFHIVVFDLYPETLHTTGIVSQNSWLYKLWQRNNRWTFAKAKNVITLSESMRKAIGKYTSANTTVIFNWADTEYIKPISRTSNPFIGAHALEGKFVVLYSGNMGLTHDLESLMDAAAIINNNDRIVFLLIGEGGKRQKLELIKSQRRLRNVVFLPYQDAVNFPFAMAAADVGVVTLGTGAESISVPSKTYVNMAAGLALIGITPRNSELNDIIEKYSVGYVVEPNQPKALAEHILRLANDPALLALFKGRSREASINFTPANAEAYIRLLLPPRRIPLQRAPPHET
jgi:glycosyltransferase involved in cell wall biosynthesis